MKAIIQWQRATSVCLWGILVLFLWSTFSACNTTTKEAILPQAEMRSTGNQQNTLIVTEDMRMPSAYKDIKGNIPRLIAMMSGCFVQYNTDGDPEHKKFTTWLVNEGKDSVLLYSFPVGEPNRNGYWVYIQQVMTSLPESPLIAILANFEEVNRDSIVVTYYHLPEEFEYTLQEILKEPVALFKEFDFEELTPSKDEGPLYFKRETPLRYIGRSDIRPTNSKKRKGTFDEEYYLITPERYFFAKNVYDKDNKYLGRTLGELLVKQMKLADKYANR